MPFDPNQPQENTDLDAAQVRAQLNALKALIDAIGGGAPASVPIGMPMGWFKNLPGVPALSGDWVECNGQVLNDAASPLDGITIPDLNGASGPPRFLRGASASGGTGGAEDHTHGLPLFQPTLGDGGTTDQYNIPNNTITAPASSLPSYYEVVWVVRVK
jgi:hypothetical protein